MADESDFQLQNSAKAIEFGLECVKTGVLVNGGAIVAILGFIGGSDAVQDTEMIREALSSFSRGLAFSLVAGLAGYFSQTAFASYNRRRHAGKDASSGIAQTIAAVGIIAVFVAYYFFSDGVARAGRALFP